MLLLPISAVLKRRRKARLFAEPMRLGQRTTPGPMVYLYPSRWCRKAYKSLLWMLRPRTRTPVHHQGWLGHAHYLYCNLSYRLWYLTIFVVCNHGCSQQTIVTLYSKYKLGFCLCKTCTCSVFWCSRESYHIYPTS